jgi:hypothetical protein
VNLVPEPNLQTVKRIYRVVRVSLEVFKTINKYRAGHDTFDDAARKALRMRKKQGGKQ